MGFLDRVDVLVLTFNEAPNIGRTLAALATFPRVVVLDSGSTDATLEIARGFANVEVRSRPFDTHARQWNFGLQALSAEWVLALDADYLLTDEIKSELSGLEPAEAAGWRARFRYCIDGVPLTGSLYPPVTVLYRREGARYVQDGHTQRIEVTGPVAELAGRILHDDRKPLSAWLAAQDRYAQLECDLLLRTPWSALGWRDRLRRAGFITPWLVPLYCLTIGRGLLDGRHGFIYALQRGVAESLLSIKLLGRVASRRSA